MGVKTLKKLRKYNIKHQFCVTMLQILLDLHLSALCFIKLFKGNVPITAIITFTYDVYSIFKM